MEIDHTQVLKSLKVFEKGDFYRVEPFVEKLSQDLLVDILLGVSFPLQIRSVIKGCEIINSEFLKFLLRILQRQALAEPFH
ncbi:hypothetical protein ES703_83024 [subsurface metagenome]